MWIPVVGACSILPNWSPSTKHLLIMHFCFSWRNVVVACSASAGIGGLYRRWPSSIDWAFIHCPSALFACKTCSPLSCCPCPLSMYQPRHITNFIIIERSLTPLIINLPLCKTIFLNTSTQLLKVYQTKGSLTPYHY